EITICVSFQHPNIVRAVDWGYYDSGDGMQIPYMVMELVHGTTLDLVLEEMTVERRRPDIRWGVRIAKGICEALAAAHERGIIHRDIKPANVMIVNGSTAKVMDFGIAREQRQSGKTTTSAALGTPAYMAPEQAGSHPVDHRADLYSLGALMYALFTYQAPFADADTGAMMLKKLTEAPLPLRRINPDVPPGLEDVVARLLERDPGRRYQSAIQVLGAIEYVERHPDRLPPSPRSGSIPAGPSSGQILPPGPSSFRGNS
ncbi:MAG: serine/threonine-protein kinase, partial [Candidatus Xenobia bacterium]